jgi:hypothetical protein
MGMAAGDVVLFADSRNIVYCVGGDRIIVVARRKKLFLAQVRIIFLGSRISTLKAPFW